VPRGGAESAREGSVAWTGQESPSDVPVIGDAQGVRPLDALCDWRFVLDVPYQGERRARLSKDWRGPPLLALQGDRA
jgi:hypothetical protein